MSTQENIGLPTLEELRSRNHADICPDTAWIWGPQDEIGRLNLLTNRRVKRTTEEEVRDGIVVSLNWDICLPSYPSFGRPPCKIEIHQHAFSKYVFDDSIKMNTQSGSQWDGLRHFGHLTCHFLYNNLSPSEVLSTDRCGMHAASEHGIVGRGVLLDYYRFAQENHKTYDPFSSHAISLDELLSCANHQGVQFHVGDILLVRSGYISRYHELEKSDPERLRSMGCPNPNAAGLEQSEEIKTWLHDSYFAAVAGDAPAFEVWPSLRNWHLHEYLIACWGMMIGEMFNLEALSIQCHKRKKYSFLFTSAPLNSRGGVASVANALAIL